MSSIGKVSQRRVTLVEIAAEAGVSRATASLILSNRTDYIRQFKPETVARVRAVAHKRCYRNGFHSSTLRTLRSSFFGLVLRGPRSRDLGPGHNQAFEELFTTGVLSVATQECIHPVMAVQEHADAADASKRINAVLDGGVFGAIIRSPNATTMDILTPRMERGLPVVLVVPDHPSEFASNMLDMDNVAAGYRAGELLARAGRRRWFVVQGSPATEAQRLREDGIRRAAPACGAALVVERLPAELDEAEIVRRLGPKLESSPFNGVFATSSGGAIGAFLACKWAALDVPGHVCIVGCDASLWRADAHPRITSIEASWYAAGRLATELLLGCRDDSRYRFENVLLAPVVVPGTTCPCGNGQGVLSSGE